MLAFLYFVQMIINLPKMLVISWNNMISIPSKPPEYTIKISNIAQKPSELWQTPEDISSRRLSLRFSICHVADFAENDYDYSWKVLEDNEVVEVGKSKNCSQNFRVKKSSKISLKIEKNAEKLTLFTVIPKNWFKTPFWIAAIGDSFSSGQGNPDVPATRGVPAKWFDESCYRSTKSFAYQAFQKTPTIPSVFSFFSCSGATVDNGILSKNGQLDKLESLVKTQKSPPDVLILTIGGNDIGFTDVISLIQRGISLENAFDMRFFYVSHQIDTVSQKIKDLKIPRVVLMTYYDVTKNEKGHVDSSCGLFGEVSTSNLLLAERKILKRLNNLLIKKAKEYGWITVDTSEIFHQNGLCSTDSLIRSRNESVNLQGNEYGSFHPNQRAHELVAGKILDVLLQ